LDKLYRLHHILGTLAFVLIINHPIFLALNYLPNTIIAKNYLFLSQNFTYNLGVFSLYSLILILIFTFIIKLPYHRWLSVHKIIGIPLFFAIFHILIINSDVSNYLPLRLWIILLLIGAVVGYIYKLFLYDQVGNIYKYKISKISRLGDITEIYLTPTSKKLIFSAGQFVFVSFKQEYIPSESHPFTISSSPDSDLIRLSIKTLGDFTATVASLKIGAYAIVKGPYGEFSKNYFQPKSVVCVAGGIGVTPFLSLIKSESLKPLSRPIYFYYSVKTNTEAVYDQEIKDYQISMPTLKYYLHVTDANNYLTAQKIKTDVPEFTNCLFYICGPSSMMTSLSAQLQQLGIKRENIIYENFSFANVH
jgi:predicted ferric reductase